MLLLVALPLLPPLLLRPISSQFIPLIQIPLLDAMLLAAAAAPGRAGSGGATRLGAQFEPLSLSASQANYVPRLYFFSSTSATFHGWNS